MEERKYIVPEGMSSAVARAVYEKCGHVEFHPQIAIALAALNWITENPIVPSPEQSLNLVKEFYESPSEMDMAIFLIREWQKRMFFSPERDVPQELKDLMEPWMNDETEAHCTCNSHNLSIMEAYRRGQKAGSK